MRCNVTKAFVFEHIFFRKCVFCIGQCVFWSISVEVDVVCSISVEVDVFTSTLFVKNAHFAPTGGFPFFSRFNGGGLFGVMSQRHSFPNTYFSENVWCASDSAFFVVFWFFAATYLFHKCRSRCVHQHVLLSKVYILRRRVGFPFFSRFSGGRIFGVMS